MNRILIMLAITLYASTACIAQNTVKYADLVVSRPAFKNYVAELHTGGNISKQQTLLKDSNGNAIKFQDEAAALNYIVPQGWEVVTAWYNQHQDATHFLLRKAGKE